MKLSNIAAQRTSVQWIQSREFLFFWLSQFTKNTILVLSFFKALKKQSLFFYLSGPRHITNPAPLSIFWVEKITHKKLQNFFEKVDWQFKTSHHLSPKHLKRHYPLKIRPDFDLKELGNLWYQKICIFWPFSDIFKFHLQ